ncbi:MAG: restriction endonuclease [Bacteroidaceae bacterium]|nr:restriction endonuclease [Bacteroidaceae bacterium]
MRQYKEFELFAQRVYKILSHNDALKPAKVEHDVKVKGKSGCEHQIDVFWEYEMEGVLHRVVIECKAFNSRVPIGRVRDFFGVLYDLGNVRGIMVSSKGFQQGAKKFAEQYGIELKELSKPDKDEVIGSLNLKFHIDMRNLLFKIDEEWAKEKGVDIQGYRERLAMFSSSDSEYWRKATHLSVGTKDDIIRDTERHQITTLKELEKQLPKNPKPGTSVVFSFKDGWIESQYWGPMKIQEVKFEYKSEVQDRELDIAAKDFVEGILKDALSGKVDYVPKY